MLRKRCQLATVYDIVDIHISMYVYELCYVKEAEIWEVILPRDGLLFAYIKITCLVVKKKRKLEL